MKARVLWSVLPALVLGNVECAPKIVAVGDPAPGGAAGGSSDGPAVARDADFRFQPADAGQGERPADPATTACAKDVRRAERIPLDLLLLMDSSSSMGDDVGAGLASKWKLAQQALTSFVRDPRSAGLGVGLQFLPHGIPATECTTDADCERPDGSVAERLSCQENLHCVGGTLPTFGSCGGSAAGWCPLGGTCQPGGLCSISKRLCLAVGQPCDSGQPGDMCRAAARVCGVGTAGGGESCSAADYQAAVVPIAPLPGSEGPLTAAIQVHTVGGGTPTGPAVQGALAYLRSHQLAHPNHRVALLLVTDGLPTECTPSEAPEIAKDIQAAAKATPSVATYAIGVFAPEEVAEGRRALAQFATAGGTGTPFVLRAAGDLSQKLEAAFDQIRGAALPCELMLPAASGAGALDYLKVNVTWKAGSGVTETVPYVESANRCDSTRGGWYYDVDPMTGTPSRIIICPTSCQSFQRDPSGDVSYAIGCKTEVIQ
jgi:hypothetical protein